MLESIATIMKCKRCGIEDAILTCLSCSMAICEYCFKEEDCGSVLCTACGGPINSDWDLVDKKQGGGIHRRCD